MYKVINNNFLNNLERGNKKVKNNRKKLPGQRTIRKKIKRNQSSCGK